MKQEFYSNGKLLITGEYTVLDGAKALALPTKFGQFLTIENTDKDQIEWTSFDHDNIIWFQATIFFESIRKNEKFPSDPIKNTLLQILHEAYILNNDFLDKVSGFKVNTTLTFPKLWGLGTSSTLINNIAQWAKIDAFKLLEKSFGGSGYDIANAQHNSPILYQRKNGKPIVEEILFNPKFKQSLYFVYLNKKQSSKTAIASYYAKRNDITETIAQIDLITSQIAKSTDLKEFSELIQKHETIMSYVLEIPTAKEIYFPDFNGSIKSLGAWGGDFVLAVSEENPINYFHQRRFKTVIPYRDMIL